MNWLFQMQFKVIFFEMVVLDIEVINVENEYGVVGFYFLIFFYFDLFRFLDEFFELGVVVNVL